MQKEKRDFTIYVFIILFYLCWIFRVYVLIPGLKFSDPLTQKLTDETLRFIFWIVLPTLFILIINKRKLNEIIGWATRQISNGFSLDSLLWFFSGFLYVLTAFASTMFFSGQKLQLQQNIRFNVVLFLNLFSVPIIEETLFRGYVFSEFKKRYPLITANILQALFFMLAHIPGWLYFGTALQTILFNGISVFALGFVFGVIAHKSKSILPSVLVHAINNALAIHITHLV